MIMIRRLLFTGLAAHYTAGFTAPPSFFCRSITTRTTAAALGDDHDHDDAVAAFDPLNLAAAADSPVSPSHPRGCVATLAAAATSLAVPLTAHAAGPDWGAFEGRTGSLLHPAAMLSTFALSLSTAWLGWQWRRQRTMGDDISALKKSLPKLHDGAKTVAAALAAAERAHAEGEDGVKADAAYVAALRTALPTANQIVELTQERKDLAKASPRDKHFGQGSLLLFIGTAFAIEGPLNTYARAGKLFPGPHLYAGAGLVVLWALAAAMVPQMQKGNDTARAIHIGANAVGMGLFVWQITSGVPILLKVIQFTQWP